MDREKYNNPLWFAAGSILLAIVLMLSGKFIGSGFTTEDPSRMPWVASSSTILLYAIGCSVGLMVTNDSRTYWSRSLYGFLALLLVIYFGSWLISGQHIDKVEGFKSVIIVLILSYITLMTVSNTVRTVVLWSKRKDRIKLEREEANE